MAMFGVEMSEKKTSSAALLSSILPLMGMSFSSTRSFWWTIRVQDT